MAEAHENLDISSGSNPDQLKNLHQVNANNYAESALARLNDSPQIVQERIEGAKELGDTLEDFLDRLGMKDFAYAVYAANYDERELRKAYWRFATGDQSEEKMSIQENNFVKKAYESEHFSSLEAVERSRRELVSVINYLIEKYPTKVSWGNVLTSPKVSALFTERVAVKDRTVHIEPMVINKSELKDTDDEMTFTVAETTPDNLSYAGMTRKFLARNNIDPNDFSGMTGIPLDFDDYTVIQMTRDLQARLFDAAYRSKNKKLIAIVGKNKETFVDGIVGKKTWSAVKFAADNKISFTPENDVSPEDTPIAKL